MALETNHPKPVEPKKGPLPKDQLPPDNPHDTTSGDTYGTKEGVKEADTQFEQVEVPKKPASNVDEDDNKGKKK
jgi:hypothetical protein